MLSPGASGHGVRWRRQPDQGFRGGSGEGYEWPQNEHGISIDASGFAWVGGNGDNDEKYLKFTRDGKFVLQIGKSGQQTNSNDVTRLGRPADAQVNPETNEVYIADGYFNEVDTGKRAQKFRSVGPAVR